MHKKGQFANLIRVYFVDKNTNKDICTTLTKISKQF